MSENKKRNQEAKTEPPKEQRQNQRKIASY